MCTYTIKSCIAMATCITPYELSGVTDNVAVYLEFSGSYVSQKKTKLHNFRSNKLSNLNVSCVLDTLCNVSYVSDTLWAVQEYNCIYVMEGSYKIYVHNS